MAVVSSFGVHLCVVPVSEPRGPSSGWYDTRESVLVRLSDTDGVTGWGEAGLRPGVVEAARELAATLLGADPRRAGALLDQLTRTTADQWAVSAIAVALDDLRARQLGISVADLYGGRRRDTVRAYASTAGYHATTEPEELWPAEAAQARADGFRAIKFRIGRYPAERELPVLAEIRAAHGASLEMMADGNGAYAVPQAFRVARALGELGFTWLEEPVNRFRGSQRYPGYRGLDASLGVAIAGGEGLERRSDFARLLDDGIDIVQPDVGICGGIGEGAFVADLAALRGRACVPHAWGGAILLAATLQLLAVTPEPTEVEGSYGGLLEWDVFENPMRTGLLTEPLEVLDGRVAIPAGPGLGIEVDESAVRSLDRLSGAGGAGGPGGGTVR
jgi:D-galactarolactone cycloisomerase